MNSKFGQLGSQQQTGQDTVNLSTLDAPQTPYSAHLLQQYINAIHSCRPKTINLRPSLLVLFQDRVNG